MNELLKQAREAHQMQIDENPETVIIYRRELVVNTLGKQVENPFGNKTDRTIKLRICQANNEAQAQTQEGIGENPGRYILLDHNSIVYKDEIFEGAGKRWRIGTVDTVMRYGGIVGYRALILIAQEGENDS